MKDAVIINQLLPTAVLAVALISPSLSQSQSLASTLDVYVFPSKGQPAEQQSKDEAECYDWAVGNTGNDPFELQKQEQEDQEKAQAEKQVAGKTGQGAGAGGAIRGAAAGAVIGEIVDDDASKGAAYGAAAGAIRGRRKGAEAQKQAQTQAEGQAQEREELTDEQLANFKKAFSVCLEAKEYMVKF